MLGSLFEGFRVPGIAEPRDRLVIAESWDAGPLIGMMLWTCIGSVLDLHKVFSLYMTSHYSSDVCNWLDIDSLANLLCLHQH